MASKYKLHVEKWRDCDKCELSNSRRKVVFARGQIPSDIVFIGEAPGKSEDVLGRPFCGPAGLKLDNIIAKADPQDLRISFYNLVSCLPPKTEGKSHAPPNFSIQACLPKLQEFVEIAKPKAVVLLGKTAGNILVYPSDFSPRKDGRLIWLGERRLLIESIIHPAAILRAEASKARMAIYKTIVVLRDLFEEVRQCV